MRTFRTLLLAVLGFSFSFVVIQVRAQSEFPPEQLLDRVTSNGIRAHMEYLADDLLEGRGTGTRGYQLAANYVRAQFEEMGLEPAGESDTYFQKVRFRQLINVPEQDSVTIKRGSQEKNLAFEKNFLVISDPVKEVAAVEAPLVFVGYGVTAPERNYDDYAGVDVKGKIVVVLVDAPASFPSSDRAYYSDAPVKARDAAAHGAIGGIVLWAGQVTQNTPWERLVGFFREPNMRWIDANGVPNDYVPEMRATVFLNQTDAAALFDGSGHTLDQAMASIAAGKPMSFPLQTTASLKVGTHFKELESPNIAGILRGSDEKLRNEYVVFTAHADHLGIGEAVRGDTIYNGAVDNASGTAALLEIARAFAESKNRPKRSLLFVVVTGEEEGLLGSDYFAQHPTVPAPQMVANINMDGVSLFYEFRDLVALGAEHSTLVRPLEDVAHHMNLEVSPDPMPEENFFIRSDQYSFVKQGVPALAISEGFKTADPSLDGKKITVAWMTTHYHTPQDDMQQPLNFKAARLCTQVILAVGYEVAQALERPTWNQGDIFGQRFGHK
jgi:Zn-dependent M28 family amino/carboxypeptidase